MHLTPKDLVQPASAVVLLCLKVKCTTSLGTTAQASPLPKPLTLGCKHKLYFPPSTLGAKKKGVFNLNYAVPQVPGGMQEALHENFL